MVTVDNLLLDLYKTGIEHLGKDVPIRDKKILLSLSRQIISGNFLTENQANLLLKIFKENKDHLSELLKNKLDYIDNPVWSKPFRVVEQIRKIFLSKEKESTITVEFTYNKRLKQHVSDISKKIEGQLISISTKQYLIPLTENNVHLIVSTFKNKGFDIDEKIMNFYYEISKILGSQEISFDVFKIKNEKLISNLEKEINEISPTNLMLLNDRKIRYQYTISSSNTNSTLANLIANRSSQKIWINSQQRSLDEVVQALKELNRLPLMLVFNGHDAKECLKNLHKIGQAAEKNNVDSHVGIYFRFDNTSEENKMFNSNVSNLKFNNNLSLSTKIAGIANNKLPKFLLKSQWYPRSVISFSNAFRNNKTSIYCDAVDLIIHYNEKQPLEGNVYAIV